MTATVWCGLSLTLAVMAFGGYCSRLPNEKLAKTGRDRILLGCATMSAGLVLSTVQALLRVRDVITFLAGAAITLTGIGLFLWGFFSAAASEKPSTLPSKAPLHRLLSVLYLILVLVSVPGLLGTAVGDRTRHALFGTTWTGLFLQETALLASVAVICFILSFFAGRLRAVADSTASVMMAPLALAAVAVLPLVPKMSKVSDLAGEHRLWAGDSKRLVLDLCLTALIPWLLTLFGWHFLLGVVTPRQTSGTEARCEPYASSRSSR